MKGHALLSEQDPKALMADVVDHPLSDEELRQLRQAPRREGLNWRSWWKLAAAKRLYAEKPRPFIWADDDLDAFVEGYERCKEVDGLPIVPRIDVSLTRVHLEEMREYIERRSRE